MLLLNTKTVYKINTYLPVHINASIIIALVNLAWDFSIAIPSMTCPVIKGINISPENYYFQL